MVTLAHQTTPLLSERIIGPGVMCGTTAIPDISCLVLQSECVCPAVYGVDSYHHVNSYDQVNSFVNIVVLQYHLIKKICEPFTAPLLSRLK